MEFGDIQLTSPAWTPNPSKFVAWSIAVPLSEPTCHLLGPFDFQTCLLASDRRSTVAPHCWEVLMRSGHSLTTTLLADAEIESSNRALIDSGLTLLVGLSKRAGRTVKKFDAQCLVLIGSQYSPALSRESNVAILLGLIWPRCRVSAPCHL